MKRLGRNVLSLFTADVIRRLLGFAAVAYLARILGTSGFGVVNIGWTVLAYGLVIGAAGLPTLGVKLTAAGERSAELPDLIGARLIVSAIVYLVIVAVALVLVDDRATSSLMIVMSLAVFAQAVWPDWYFQGVERVAPLAASRVLSSAVYLAVIIAMVHSVQDVLWVAAGALAGDIVAAAYLIRQLKTAGLHFAVRVKPAIVCALLLRSFPLAAGGILAHLSINYAPLALGALRTTSEVGVYGAASKLVFFLLVGDRIMSTVLLPASARLHARSAEELAATLGEALRWILMISLPVAVGAMVLAGPIIGAVFGDSYLPAIPVFRIFIWYFFFTMLHTVYTSGLIATEGLKAYGSVMLATAGLYAVTVTAGAAFAGPIGAAFGVVLSEGISLILMRRALAGAVRLAPPKGTLGMIAAAGLMGVAVWSVAGQFILLPLAVGIVAYPAFVLLFRTAGPADLRQFIGRF